MISILQRKHQTILLQNDKLVIVQGRRVSGGLFAFPGILQEMVICKNHAVSIYEKGKGYGYGRTFKTYHFMLH